VAEPDSEALLKLMELLPDPAVAICAGRYVGLNAQAARLLGAGDARQLLGADALLNVLPEHRAAAMQWMGQSAGDGTAPRAPAEGPILRLDGGIVEVEITACTVQYQGRGALLAILRDISVRKGLQGALRESEDRYRELVERSPDSVMVILDGRYVYVNPAGAKLAGAPDAAAMIGRNVRENIHPDDCARVTQRWRQLVTSGAHNPPLEEKLLRFDGQTVAVEAVSSAVTWQGRPAVQVLLRDLTGRQQMEQALRASQERYRNLFESMDQGYASCALVYDAAGKPVDIRYLEVNPAFCRLLGRPAQTIVGQTVRQVFPDLVEERVATYARIVAEGAGERAERPMPSLGKFFDTYAWPCGPGCFAMLVSDVTKRKHTEQSRREAHEELEARVAQRTAELRAANEALEQRAAQLRNLAARLILTEQSERQRLAQGLHDGLLQLLHAAKIHMELIGHTRPAPGIAKPLHEARRLLAEAIAAARLLNADFFPPVPAGSSMADYLEWLATSMAENHQLSVHVEADPRAQPDTREVGVLLFQSVRELLVNVVKYAGVAEARVTLERAGDEAIRIVVSDQGAGFDPLRLAKPDARGGFGLFSIRERLELMGGRCTVDSAPGRGTRVTLTAPRHARHFSA
jgi:PAS domain S-box-containing protein